MNFGRPYFLSILRGTRASRPAAIAPYIKAASEAIATASVGEYPSSSASRRAVSKLLPASNVKPAPTPPAIDPTFHPRAAPPGPPSTPPTIAPPTAPAPPVKAMEPKLVTNFDPP